MTPMTGRIIGGIAFTIACVVVALALGNIFNPQSEPQVVGDVDECSGCAALRALGDQFPDDAGALQSAWTEQISECAADPVCRAAPQRHFDAFCSGPWPNGDTFQRLGDALDRLASTGSACRDAVCPDIDCSARARTVSELGELRQAIATVADAHDRRAEHLVLALDTAEALITRLGSVASQIEQASAWATDVEQFAATVSGDVDISDVAVQWRLRRIADHLTDVAALLTSADAEPDWSGVASRAASAGIELHRGRAAFEAATSPHCGGLDLERADNLRERARHAEALLAVCAARAACDGGDVASSIVPFGARGAGGIDDLRSYADAVTTALEGAASLGLVPQPAPVLRLERDVFSEWEAILVELDVSETACMAEPGALLAIIDPGHPDAPLFTSALADRPQQDVLLEAPRRSGSYEVAALAPLARGGGMLATAPIAVDGARPTACDGFGGVWRTGFGELVMYEHDGVARGTYRRFEDVRPGFLVGEVSGGVLRGDWESELGSGSVRLQLASDGLSFSGSWTHSRGASAGSGRWAGACVASE